MPAKLGRDGKAEKVDYVGDIDLKPFDVPPDLLNAIDMMRKEGYSDDEINAELHHSGNAPQQSRIPSLSTYPQPTAPLSQQTIDRVHGETSRSFEEKKSTWINTGKAVLQNQFLQTKESDEMELVKDSHTANLLASRGGFSAGNQIVDVLFGKRLLKKSRVDLGVPNERAWTVGQFSLSNQRFEEVPDRPKGNTGFFRGLLGK